MTWLCGLCETVNPSLASKCEVCDGGRPENRAAVADAPQPRERESGGQHAIERPTFALASRRRRMIGHVLDWIVGWIAIAGAAIFSEVEVLAIGINAATIVLFAWLSWFIIACIRSQSPGKQLVGTLVCNRTGDPAGFFHTGLRELVIKYALIGIIVTVIALGNGEIETVITLGAGWLLAAAWCVWDSRRQCLWDKLARTYICTKAA